MFEEKENRYRLVCHPDDKDKVLKNIEKYYFLKLVGSYKKNYWVNIIIDSKKYIDYKFVKKFNNQIGGCLGAFECYDKYYD